MSYEEIKAERQRELKQKVCDALNMMMEQHEHLGVDSLNDKSLLVLEAAFKKWADVCAELLTDYREKEISQGLMELLFGKVKP